MGHAEKGDSSVIYWDLVRGAENSPARLIVFLSSTELSVRLARLNHLLAISVEGVVDNPLGLVVLDVILESQMAESFGDGFKSARLRLTPEGIVGIGAVDNFSQQHQGRVAVQAVLFDD